MNKTKIVIGIVAVIMLFTMVGCNKEIVNNIENSGENNEIENVNNAQNNGELEDIENVVNDETITNEPTDELKNDEIIRAEEMIKEYMNIVEGQFYFDTILGLKNLGLNIPENISTDENGFGNTGISFSEFKEALLMYVSEEYFDSKYENSNQFKNIDGILHVMSMGASGWGYDDVELELISKEDNFYNFKIYGTGIDEVDEVYVHEFNVKLIMTENGLRIHSDIKYI